MPTLKLFQVIIDCAPAYESQAPDSFTAWKLAIEAHPDAQRVEVKAPKHALVFDRTEGFENASLPR